MKEIIDSIKQETNELCLELGFDVAILWLIDESNIIVKEIYGDHFARPDITLDKTIQTSGKLYQNEFSLAKKNSDTSFIPTDGLGADCGFRIKGTPYFIVFDDVLSDLEVNDEGKLKLKKFQEKLEEVFIDA